MPVFIASNPEWVKKFEEKNIPIMAMISKLSLGLPLHIEFLQTFSRNEV